LSITRAYILAAALTAIALAGTLACLRDPPWLLSMSSGLRQWETSSDGRRFRWAGPHASFFVPSDRHDMRLPLRTTFDRPDEWPIAVSIAIDDEPAERIVLSTAEWRDVVVRLPPRANRRVRRVDLRADRARDDNRAVQVGEITLR
jgi:hypothetical protein